MGTYLRCASAYRVACEMRWCSKSVSISHWALNKWHCAYCTRMTIYLIKPLTKSVWHYPGSKHVNPALALFY